MDVENGQYGVLIAGIVLKNVDRVENTVSGMKLAPKPGSIFYWTQPLCAGATQSSISASTSSSLKQGGGNTYRGGFTEGGRKELIHIRTYMHTAVFGMTGQQGPAYTAQRTLPNSL